MSDPQGAFAWLVEENYNDEIMYQSARGWTFDPCQALRYARREDAQAVVDAAMSVWAEKGVRRDMRAVEHGFAPVEC